MRTRQIYGILLLQRRYFVQRKKGLPNKLEKLREASH